jgi:hypothetical protein
MKILVLVVIQRERREKDLLCKGEGGGWVERGG